MKMLSLKILQNTYPTDSHAMHTISFPEVMKISAKQFIYFAFQLLLSILIKTPEIHFCGPFNLFQLSIGGSIKVMLVSY